VDPCSVTFKVHEAFERELRTFVVGEWTVLARLKTVVPVKVALQRMLTAEKRVVVRAGAAWHCRCNVDIERVDIGAVRWWRVVAGDD